jgi:hypothetical protein
MAIKVKELKDDVLIDVKVNKSFYMMLKGTIYYLFNQIEDAQKREEALKNVMNNKYEDMTAYERSFYTLTLIIAEIERVAAEQNMYKEETLLEPDDEGYTEPTEE